MKAPAWSLVLVFAVALLAACSAAAGPPAGRAAESTPAAALPQLETSAALPASTSTGSPLSSSPLTGKIVYSREGDVYVMNADGTEVSRLTDDPAMDFDPAWSPDGAQIAFRSHRDGNEEVYRMNADGSDQRNLSNAPGESKLPAWSPDGARIAFQSNRDGWPTLPEFTPLGYDPQRFGDYEIYVMDADGSGQVNVTHHPQEDDSFPAWSQDGNLIFSRYGCLMVLNTGDSKVEKISKGACTGTDSGEFPDWYQPVTN